ncbi:MAG: hypothetical protein HQ552_06085 [Desulfobacteraceae bacterium]|nr:hypothetical protein [Desulfobacteraceae bacterium]
MCQSYRKVCACGQNTTEIFFGRMIFDEQVVAKVYCPNCSQNIATDCDNRMWDNGWVLELNMEVVQAHIPVMDIAPEDVTADRIFDEGYVTWVGITPDDHQTREQERNQIQKLAKTDLLAYIQAMKEWGLNREKRFVNEGWRKMRARAIH